MSKSADDMYFMVSLYGMAMTGAGVVSLMGDVIEFLREAGEPPSHLSVVGRGFGKMPLLFDRAWQRLQKATPADLECASAYRFTEPSRGYLSPWTVACNIYTDLSCFQLGASMDVIPDAERQIVGFIRRSLTRIRPGYGIGFMRPRSQGPLFYGLGVSYGHRAYSGPEYEESLAISRWSGGGFEDAVYNDGILRDAYPYSFVTQRHLERDIDGRSLRDWIAAEPWRGALEPCEGGCVLWTVATEHVAEVRRQLIASGALYAWLA